MFTPLFYLFAIITVLGGIGVVAWKNPVSSALCMVASFVGIAGLFVGLNAYFIGILQVLVYAGAIMVLFIFIIMLLDLKPEKYAKFNPPAIAASIIIPMMILFQLTVVLSETPNSDIIINETTLQIAEQNELTTHPDDTSGKIYVPEDSKIREALKEGNLPDVHLIGNKMFTEFHFPVQIIGLLLLVATVGCIVLSKKTRTDAE